MLLLKGNHNFLFRGGSWEQRVPLFVTDLQRDKIPEISLRAREWRRPIRWTETRQSSLQRGGWAFRQKNNKKVTIVQSNQMVDCQEQRRRMWATLAGKYVHIRRMERDHKNEEPRPPCLQNRFFLQTTLSIVHQIHNDLYDLSDFAADHPGGQSWIEMTRGQVKNSQLIHWIISSLILAGTSWWSRATFL